MSIIAAHQAEVGPMITGGDVELAVRDMLAEWLPPYLCVAEEKHGWKVGGTPWPKGWVFTGRDLQKLNSDQLPCVVIMAGGILEPPIKEGAPGTLTATWTLDIGAIFSAAWGRSSRQHSQLYAAAIRTLMMQRPLALGPGAVVDLQGEVYDESDISDSRTYSASVVSFHIEVREVGWAAGGPPPLVSPPDDPTVPYDEWTRVTATDVTVENTGHPNSD